MRSFAVYKLTSLPSWNGISCRYQNLKIRKKKKENKKYKSLTHWTFFTKLGSKPSNVSRIQINYFSIIKLKCRNKNVILFWYSEQKKKKKKEKKEKKKNLYVMIICSCFCRTAAIANLQINELQEQLESEANFTVSKNIDWVILF